MNLNLGCLILSLLITALAAVGAKAYTSYDNPPQKVQVESTLVTKLTEENEIRAAAHNQLFFLIGNLGPLNQHANLASVQFTKKSYTPLKDGFIRFDYTAELIITRKLNSSTVKRLKVALPLYTDEEHLNDFYYSYVDCKQSTDFQGWEGFYNTFSPYTDSENQDPALLRFCKSLLNRPSYKDVNVQNYKDINLITTSLQVLDSNINTNKAPEYQRIWEDDVLEITVFTERFSNASLLPHDGGIRAYNLTYRTVISDLHNMGLQQLRILSPELSTQPFGISNPDIVTHQITAVYGNRKVIVNLMLINAFEFYNPRPEFLKFYKKTSRTSDIVIFSGHTTFLKNIPSLAKFSDFEKNRYQIYFIHGCNAFDYLDTDLFKQKAKITPTDPTGTRTLDIITNLQTSPFLKTPASVQVLLKSLLNSTDSYKEITRKLEASVPDTNNREEYSWSTGPIVIGEEDNE